MFLSEKFRIKMTYFKVWLMCVINSLAIYAERDGRVGPINNLVIAHLVIGFMKKHKVCLRVVCACVFAGVCVGVCMRVCVCCVCT